MKLGLFLGMLALMVAPPASAQQAPADDPVATAPIRIGALGVDPRVSLTNFGVDTNVFNAVSDPQRDFTFTVSPMTDIWLRTGKGLLTITGSLDFVYFSQYSTQRSIASNATGRYELRLDRVRPYASASTANTEQRPGYEIDLRAKHYETDFHFGSDLRIASKSTVGLDFQQLDYTFAGGEVFDGRPLNQELNRRLRTANLAWSQRLTALTTWVTTVSRESQRFEFEDLRNSDSFRLSSGFELGRFALIRGSAFAGYRRLTAADGGLLPRFSGFITNADVSYTAASQTRLGVAVSRDIQYSYDRGTPYYVQTSWTTTLTQRVTGRWDVQLTGGRDRLAYQSLVARLDARTDSIGRFGGGIGYAIGEQLRASFDVKFFYRSSDIPGRDYGGIRSGLSMTYGY